MTRAPLEAAYRAASGRVIAALAARFRDLDLAEDSFAEACARAAQHWPEDDVPADPAAWLYRAAERAALDMLRRRAVRSRHMPDLPEPCPNPEEALTDDAAIIPDDRLRLIFVCCHPAVAADARAALTLRLVCGLSAPEIARAFLLSEPTLRQRLTRAKRKIAAAGIAYEVPGPDAWPDRIEAVLSTIEIAYSKAHEDAAGAGRHAGFASEMLDLAGLLARLLPDEPDVHALAATILYAEARRPARIDSDGGMIPLSEQDPSRWRRALIARADAHMARALAGPLSARIVQAAIHQAWCMRASLAEPPPWRPVLALYDRLLDLRDDVVVRLNRAVALAEVAGAKTALAEVEQLDAPGLAAFAPWHLVRADLLRRTGARDDAASAYRAALALDPPAVERAWIETRLRSLVEAPERQARSL